MTEHYFTKSPTSELRIHNIKLNINNKDYELYTASGLFSLREILDLGCGYGVIGFCLKILHPNIELVMSDINERAIMISKKNFAKYNLKAKIVQSDCFNNIKDKFDSILLNPPQAAGKDICFKMIRESKDHLKNNGILQIVARHNKGGKTLSVYMKEIFGNVNESKKHAGIRVYISINN